MEFPGATNEGGTKHMCIKTIPGKEDRGEILPHGCGETGGEMTILATVTSSEGKVMFKCAYTRSAAITGTFTTNSAPATLKLEGQPEFTKESGSFLCPTTQKLTQLAFNIYTDNEEETPLSIS